MDPPPPIEFDGGGLILGVDIGWVVEIAGIDDENPFAIVVNGGATIFVND